jgi:hypothetical protein
VFIWEPKGKQHSFSHEVSIDGFSTQLSAQLFNIFICVRGEFVLFFQSPIDVLSRFGHVKKRLDDIEPLSSGGGRNPVLHLLRALFEILGAS